MHALNLIEIFNMYLFVSSWFNTYTLRELYLNLWKNIKKIFNSNLLTMNLILINNWLFTYLTTSNLNSTLFLRHLPIILPLTLYFYFSERETVLLFIRHFHIDQLEKAKCHILFSFLLSSINISNYSIRLFSFSLRYSKWLQNQDVIIIKIYFSLARARVINCTAYNLCNNF